MIIPLFLASLALARSVRGAAYIGCVATGSIPASGLTQADLSLGACNSLCSSNGFSHSFYDAASSSCSCASSEGSGDNYVGAADSGGSCAVGEVSVWYLSTAFSFEGCSAETSSGSNTRTNFANSAFACLSGCTSFERASFTRFGPQYICVCADVLVGQEPISCQSAQASTGFYVYGQSLEPEPTGNFGRRQLKEKLRLARALKHQYCPVGLTACVVGEDQEAFECVDTRSDLESCGGCTAGLYGAASQNATISGKDCSVIPGVALGAVTCTRGSCDISACKYGYALIDNVCERMY